LRFIVFLLRDQIGDQRLGCRVSQVGRSAIVYVEAIIHQMGSGVIVENRIFLRITTAII